MKILIHLVIILLSSSFANANSVQKDYSLPNKTTIIGSKIITNNKKLSADVPKLLTKLFREKLIDKLSAQKVDTIYIVYSNYQNKTEGEFEVIVGIKTEEKWDNLPEGTAIITIPAGRYSNFHVTGKSFKVVTEAWSKILQIWGDDGLKSNNTTRTYKVDYQVYPIEVLTNRKAPVEMDIFIGIK